VASAEEIAALNDDEPGPNVVYIAEGDQLGYLPEAAKAVWAIS
jgi:hypothetical protein